MSKRTILCVLVLSLNFLFAIHIWASTMTNPVDYTESDFNKAPLLIKQSPYSLAVTVEQVKRAVAGQNFKIIRQLMLDHDASPVQQSVTNEIIIYFCNFNKLDRALKLDKRTGLFLPCRITIIERDGKVILMAVNPKKISTLFQNHSLDELCDELNQNYLAILEEATL